MSAVFSASAQTRNHSIAHADRALFNSSFRCIVGMGSIINFTSVTKGHQYALLYCAIHLNVNSNFLPTILVEAFKRILNVELRDIQK